MTKRKILIAVVAFILCLGIIAVIGNILLNSESNNVYSQGISNPPENEEEEQLVRIKTDSLNAFSILYNVLGLNSGYNRNFGGVWIDESDDILNILYTESLDEFKEVLAPYIISDEEYNGEMVVSYVRFARQQFNYNYLNIVNDVLFEVMRDFSIRKTGVTNSTNSVHIYHREESNTDEILEYLYSVVPGFNRNSVTFIFCQTMPVAGLN